MNDYEIDLLTRNGIKPVDIVAKGNYGCIISCTVDKYQGNCVLKRVPEMVFNVSDIEFLRAADTPRINKLINYYTYEGKVYILFEQCQYNILNYIKLKQGMTNEDKVKLIQEMIMAVKACHDRNLAHSNIKPTNFLVDSLGRVKVTDYGLSYIWKDDPRSVNYKGSRVFLAPEHFSGEKYDIFKADVWALGVSLYYIAVGQLPFLSKDPELLIKSIQSGIFMEGLIEDPLLRELIKGCLTPDPDERCTCDDLLEMPYFDVIKNTPIQLHSLKRRASLKWSRDFVKRNSSRRSSLENKDNNLGLSFSHETFSSQQFFDLHKNSY